MIAYAAIDLRGGRVVQLVGGRVQDERVSWPDPVAVAQRWQTAGFAALHVVDLDAALDSGHNRVVIEDIIAAVNIPVQVGGGLRDDDAVARALEAGAARVVVGTRAVEDQAWRHRISERYPEKIIVAADVRGGSVVTRGWQQATSQQGATFIRNLRADPLAAVLVTDVTREGQMLGVDAALFAELSTASAHPLIAAGGIRDLQDLRALAEAGVAGAVLGMALYQGALDPAEITPEYAA
ncbi:MAG TPA: 1-(5-phosphoribosyl)-5-[(5-phosphoribosylamino)methylideneamino] imidazole-4-carboxamide isomerase [Longimicrobiales bacterium]|nr:1-(5-phosphoribosyl)-5-[(5-phosphoribosylamino)methylideneamino] imidazole-4-carboxamide isomerase [Longimicrobiales bacterium]